MAKDEWVRAAMEDDMMVVELLLRLKQAQAASTAKYAAVLPDKWGMRKPRSRRSVRCGGVERRKENDASTRCSPTTPLSWSGGGGEASPSGTADGLEDTSRSPSGTRSKIASTSEATSITIRRKRKKKSFSELKEEVNFLLKERIHLKKELAIVRATFKKQRAINENLERIKVDLGFHPAKNSNSISNKQEKGTCCQEKHSEAPPVPRHATTENHLESYSSEAQAHKDVSIQRSSFLLPDLNMMPMEEDSTYEATVYGMR